MQNLASKNQVKFSGSQEGRGKVPEGLKQAYTKNGAVLLPSVGRPFGHTGTLDGLEQAHTKKGAALLQNVAPPFGKTRALEDPLF